MKRFYDSILLIIKAIKYIENERGDVQKLIFGCGLYAERVEITFGNPISRGGR